ncbi:MAG: hypothetical protein KAT10_01595 [Sulfurimonas sp.]|nr:hypothetical protein [Sulfurimonas sp.]
MFISTYNTYINTNTSEKSHKQAGSRLKDKAEPFNLELSKNPVLKSNITKNLPIDYVSNYKSFNTQQKLQEQAKSPNEIKFNKIKNMDSAKVAYEEGSKMFPLFKKPSSALSQPIKMSKEAPQNIQDLKEENLRHVMVNTYIVNDKYYQITA